MVATFLYGLYMDYMKTFADLLFWIMKYSNHSPHSNISILYNRNFPYNLIFPFF